MPTVLRKDGFVVRVYGPPREHPPPHVHVERGPEEIVVIRLGTADGPAKVWAVYGMKDRRGSGLPARGTASGGDSEGMEGDSWLNT